MQEVTIRKNTVTKELNFLERFTKTTVWPAYVGCLAAFLYAVFVRFYHAAGGTIGMPIQMKDPTIFYMASYYAGLIIMFCGFALIVLVNPWVRNVPKKVPLLGGIKIHPFILLTPTLIGTTFLLTHGISGVITKALLLAGVISLNFPSFVEVDVQKLALWDLFFYEPWFIFMGIMASLTAAHYAQASGIKQSIFRYGTVLFVIVVFLLSALVTLSIILDFADKISFKI